MKTKIHYGNKVSTVKGNTVFCDTELELFNKTCSPPTIAR